MSVDAVVFCDPMDVGCVIDWFEFSITLSLLITYCLRYPCGNKRSVTTMTFSSIYEVCVGDIYATISNADFRSMPKKLGFRRNYSRYTNNSLCCDSSIEYG